ncbi:MAG: right-handed parallel beta-helix repeat-containing protein [bacterium]|nr:right-handed parallel beta-helix repeat-containing protein [bacterium]
MIKIKLSILILFLFIGCQRVNIRETVVKNGELNNISISKDTVWSGSIYIKGVVTVKRGVVLTILPGTNVLFEKTKVDNDEIGDSELNIEGKVIAEGTREAPIVFTSSEKEKKPVDWKFVYLSFNENSRLSYCKFEYAFTGLQVHYSEVHIDHCLFENNVEGMRYSTVRLLLENSIFRNNVYGLRYEERRSEAVVRNNDFKQNEFGIFCVMRSDDKTRFLNNNISNNKKYNFIMGQEQEKSIDAGSNYWGSDNESEILQGIFDGRKEETVGIVNFLPYLMKRVDIEE